LSAALRTEPTLRWMFGRLKTDTVSYDPRRLQGVKIYRETERVFAAGDRVKSTAPNRARDVANRELGTIERVEANGRMEIRW
jgi:hypothetical protein